MMGTFSVNAIIYCFSLQDKELYILTIGTKTKSWWLEHGVGCQVTNSSWLDEISPESSRPIPPEQFVEGCILQYYYVEVIHAAVQCLFAVSPTSDVLLYGVGGIKQMQESAFQSCMVQILTVSDIFNFLQVVESHSNLTGVNCFQNWKYK